MKVVKIMEIHIIREKFKYNALDADDTLWQDTVHFIRLKTFLYSLIKKNIPQITDPDIDKDFKNNKEKEVNKIFQKLL